MDRVKNIVVGVDFSERSKNALRAAMRIAQWNTSKVHVVHAIESPVVAELARAYGVDESHLDDDVRSSAGQRVEAMVSAARDVSELVAESHSATIEVDTDVRVGHPLYVLLDTVRDHAADLLVLGTNGESDPQRGPGALAIKSVRKVPTKVMLIRNAEDQLFRRIAACVDLSDLSHEVVAQAIRVARQEEAALDIVHVFTPPWHREHYMSPSLVASPAQQEQYRDYLHSGLDACLEPFAPEIRHLRCERHLVEADDIKVGLVDFLASSKADLAVLGTRRPAGYTGLLMGTTAERVLRNLPCSLLAIKPPNFSFEPEQTKQDGGE